MDFESEVLKAAREIPRIRERALEPTLDDRIFEGRLGMDSYDFAEIVVILHASIGVDPFARQAPTRDRLHTLRDLARAYANASND